MARGIVAWCVLGAACGSPTPAPPKVTCTDEAKLLDGTRDAAARGELFRALALAEDADRRCHDTATAAVLAQARRDLDAGDADVATLAARAREAAAAGDDIATRRAGDRAVAAAPSLALHLQLAAPKHTSPHVAWIDADRFAVADAASGQLTVWALSGGVPLHAKVADLGAMAAGDGQLVTGDGTGFTIWDDKLRPRSRIASPEPVVAVGVARGKVLAAKRHAGIWEDGGWSDAGHVQFHAAFDAAGRVYYSMGAWLIRAEHKTKTFVQMLHVWKLNSSGKTAPIAAHEWLAMAPDGGIAVRHVEGRIALVDAAGRLRSVLFPDHPATSLAVLVDGTIAVATTGPTIQLFAADGAIKATLATGTVVRALAASPDGRLLAAGGDDRVELWDTATGVRLATLYSPAAGRWLVFTDDGRVDGVLTAQDPVTWRLGEHVLPWQAGLGRQHQEALLRTVTSRLPPPAVPRAATSAPACIPRDYDAVCEVTMEGDRLHLCAGREAGRPACFAIDPASGQATPAPLPPDKALAFPSTTIQVPSKGPPPNGVPVHRAPPLPEAPFKSWSSDGVYLLASSPEGSAVTYHEPSGRRIARGLDPSLRWIGSTLLQVDEADRRLTLRDVQGRAIARVPVSTEDDRAGVLWDWSGGNRWAFVGENGRRLVVQDVVTGKVIADARVATLDASFDRVGVIPAHAPGGGTLLVPRRSLPEVLVLDGAGKVVRRLALPVCK